MTLPNRMPDFQTPPPSMAPESSMAPAQGGPSGDLRSNFLKSRIAKLPHLPALAPHSAAAQGQAHTDSSLASHMSSLDASGPPPGGIAEEEEEGEEEDDFGSFPCTPKIPGSGSASRTQRRRGPMAAEDWSPKTAEGYFEEALEVDVPDAGSSAPSSSSGTFRVYYTPPRPRRSGGSGSSSALPKPARPAAATEADLMSIRPPVISDEEESPRGTAASSAHQALQDEPGTVFVLIHGAGFSALSWALMAKEITQITEGEAGVLAVDVRGHGRTKHLSAKPPLDMSLQTLTTDLVGVLKAVFGASSALPNLVLVGHSMGGSLAVSLADALLKPPAGTAAPLPGIRVTGVAVLDVVEGTAMEAMEGMEGIVRALPKGFASVEDAIKWHVRESNTLQNRESARISVPPLIVPNPLYDAAAAAQSAEADEPMEEMSAEGGPATATATSDLTSLSKRFPFTWRADLLASAPYWRGWFDGLSERFLGVRCARLLLLAGADRLDKELMIGQMQGKYQLVVFQDVGHCLQEDAPERTARTLVDFWKRNESIKITRMVPGQGKRENVQLHKVGQ